MDKSIFIFSKMKKKKILIERYHQISLSVFADSGMGIKITKLCD